MTRQILLTILLGGVAAVDAMPVAQSLLFQPLVTSGVLALLWGGDASVMALALEVGLVLQVFAAGTLPIGSRTPEDYATGGVVGTGVALALATHVPFGMGHDACAMAGSLCGMVTATLGVPVLKWQRRRNESLSRWCEEALRRGEFSALSRAHAASVAVAFAAGVVFCAVFLAAGSWALRPVVEQHSIRLAKAWSMVHPVWLGLGLAHLLNAFVQRRFTRAALFGFGLITGWILLMIQGA
jgi:mannose/fructose/N-acetylgalactosamine-specific phosphotransferase system component IIC